MSGWLLFALLAAAVLGLVVLVARADRSAAMLVAAALLVAATGYAWQGSPALPGAPADGRKQDGLKRDTLFASERTSLLNAYGETGQWLTLADGLNRAGQDQAAVSALIRPIERKPDDVALRLGYAHALLVLADYNMTPAVQLAFERAEAIDPNDPAPLYFQALARFEAGDLQGAERSWQGLYDALPPASPWRAVVDRKLKLFEMMRRQM